MKAVINKKRYDTDTAVHVASYDSGHSSSDFNCVSEILCRTKNGSWFLAGEGGAMTSYASHSGDNTGYGYAIIPFTPEEALDWLEQHNETDAIEEYFKDSFEDA